MDTIQRTTDPALTLSHILRPPGRVIGWSSAFKRNRNGERVRQTDGDMTGLMQCLVTHTNNTGDSSAPAFLFYFLYATTLSQLLVFFLCVNCFVSVMWLLRLPFKYLSHITTLSETDACGRRAADSFHDGLLPQRWHICNQTAELSLPVPQTQSRIHKSAFIKTNQVHDWWINLRISRCQVATALTPA